MKKKITDNAWKKIKLILLDVDGVLTTGKLVYNSVDYETKSFSVKDGCGIIEARKAGIEFGIVTARESVMVKRRAEELGIKFVYQNFRNKLEVLKKLLNEKKYSADEILFVGDEIIDLPIMINVGIGVAVNNASDDVKKYADYVTVNNGGDGAVREVIEKLLKFQNKWQNIINEYLIRIN